MIYADFMKMDDKARLLLTCFGTHKDLEEQEIILKDGLSLVFYNEDEDDNGDRDDLVVQGIVRRNTGKNIWVAEIDWNEIKNISRLTFDEKQRMKIF